jgi:hypothetical protein
MLLSIVTGPITSYRPSRLLFRSATGPTIAWVSLCTQKKSEQNLKQLLIDQRFALSSLTLPAVANSNSSSNSSSSSACKDVPFGTTVWQLQLLTIGLKNCLATISCDLGLVTT